MAILGNVLGFGQQPGVLGGGYQPPRLPWGQNPMVTMAGLSLLGAPTLQQGLQNVGANAGAGMAAKVGMQRDIIAQQEKAASKAEQDARRAQMNEVMKAWPGLSPEQRALFSAQPELFGQYAMGTMAPKEGWESLTDPQQRLSAGIPLEDTRPVQRNTLTGEVKFPGGGGTNINVNTAEKLTEGQSKDVNFYARGRSADAELGAREKALTDLPQSLWQNVPIAGNYALTPEYQVAKRAAAEFLAVVLRKDTGAAVTPSEFELYGPMFLPAPGDSDQVLEAKRKARKQAMDSIKRGLGTARGMADDIDAEMSAEAEAGVTPPPAGGTTSAPIPAADYFKQTP